MNFLSNGDTLRAGKDYHHMFTLGAFRIGDDLNLSIGDQSVQLRPAQGLRAVEALLRASTRRMMEEEAAAVPATSKRVTRNGSRERDSLFK